jgi:hypothetical protein
MPDEELNQTVEVNKKVKGRLVPSFTLPSPKWATTVFRIVFCVTTALTMIITAEPAISANVKVHIFIYLKAIDFVIWFMGRGMGIDKSQFENEAKAQLNS